MSSDAELLLTEVRRVRELLELLAEPAIAERDKKLRAELQRIATGSKMQKAVMGMDGTRTQSQIAAQIPMSTGQLSELVTKLEGSGLLADGKKKPKLAITIPSTFFDANTDTKRR